MLNSNKGPLVSICIPVFNDVNKIQRAIESALNQSYDNIELVISDNASNDGTIDIVNNYLGRAVVLTSEKNKGSLFNWKKVLSASNGKYVLFLGSDDYIDRNYVTELINKINPDDGFISGSVQYVCDNFELDFLFNPVEYTNLDNKNFFLTMMKGNKMNLLVAGIFKRDIFEKMLESNITWNDRKMASERIWLLKAFYLSNGKYSVVSNVVYYKNKIPNYNSNKKGFAKKCVASINEELSQIFLSIKSSLYFFNEIVMLDNLSIRKRIVFTYYWTIWTASRVKFIILGFASLAVSAFLKLKNK